MICLQPKSPLELKCQLYISTTVEIKEGKINSQFGILVRLSHASRCGQSLQGLRANSHM
jgi:hypothetical protein